MTPAVKLVFVCTPNNPTGPVLTTTEGEDFLAKVPGAEFAELSGAGHTAAGDDNDAFSEVVSQFVLRR